MTCLFEGRKKHPEKPRRTDIYVNKKIYKI